MSFCCVHVQQICSQWHHRSIYFGPTHVYCFPNKLSKQCLVYRLTGGQVLSVRSVVCFIILPDESAVDCADLACAGQRTPLSSSPRNWGRRAPCQRTAVCTPPQSLRRPQIWGLMFADITCVFSLTVMWTCAETESLTISFESVVWILEVGHSPENLQRTYMYVWQPHLKAMKKLCKVYSIKWVLLRMTANNKSITIRAWKRSV